MGTPERLERLDDHARPVGGGLDEGAVDLRRRGGQGRPDEQAREVDIDEDGAVAVPPVERHQAGLAGLQPGGLSLEHGVDVDALGLSRLSW